MRASSPSGRDLHAHAVPFPFGRDVVRHRAPASRPPRSDWRASAGGRRACPRHSAARLCLRARRRGRYRAAPARATPPRSRQRRGRSSRRARSWRAAPRPRRAGAPPSSFSSAQRPRGSRRSRKSAMTGASALRPALRNRRDDLVERRSGRPHGRLRPQQRDGLGRIADVVARQLVEHRVDPVAISSPSARRKGRRGKEPVGQRRQRVAAVGIGGGAEIFDQQRELAVARGRGRQPVENVGEALHDGLLRLVLEAHEGKRTRFAPHEPELIDERVLAPVRHPHLLGARRRRWYRAAPASRHGRR